MKSPMLPADHQAAVRRVLALGRSGDPTALPELDVYIEYRGLDTPQYKMSMYKKQTLYQQEGKRLISVYPTDLPRLAALLTAKLKVFGYAVSIDERSEISRTAGHFV